MQKLRQAEALGSDGRLTQTHNAVIVHPCGRAYDLLHLHSLRRGSPAMVGRGCVGPSIPLALGRLRYYMCAQGPWEQQNEPCNATRTMHGAMGKLLRLSRQPPHWPERPCLLAEARSHTYTHTPCAGSSPVGRYTRARRISVGGRRLRERLHVPSRRLESRIMMHCPHMQQCASDGLT